VLFYLFIYFYYITVTGWDIRVNLRGVDFIHPLKSPWDRLVKTQVQKWL